MSDMTKEFQMNYKGYYIDGDLLEGGVTVFYCGDEIFFDTVDEAKAFIEEITRKN